MTIPSSIPRRDSPEAATPDAKVHSRRPPILVVSSVREDRALLRHILWPEHRTVAAGTCHDALHRMEHGRIPLVLCDCRLPDGTWMDILRAAAALPDPPLLVVTSHITDGRLWAEVINLGGFDLIAKPFHAHEVRHVVHTAWIRKARHTVRHCA